MKGMIWNSDGFGDTGTHFTVQEAVREHNLDFVAIIETGEIILQLIFSNI